MPPTQRRLANAIRALAMDAVETANSGHPGMPMGMADAATALFTKHLKYDPADPAWPDRVRFVLSAGHGSMLIYALLYLTGYERPTMDDIKRFRQLHSPCAGDGDLMEGVNHVAVGLAGHLKLGRLIVLWDDNRITIDGSTDLLRNEDVVARHAAAGWHTLECDGLDSGKVGQAIDKAVADERPSLIRVKTIIGYGAPNKQGTAATHGAALGKQEVEAARQELGLEPREFTVPDDVLASWREVGKRGHLARAEWHRRLDASRK